MRKTLNKTLILDPAGLLWGSERALLDYLRFMNRKPECRIAVCCPSGTPLEKEIDQLSRIEKFTILSRDLHRKSFGHRLLALFELVLVIAKYRPSVICLNQAGMTKLVLLAAKPFSIPVIVHLRMFDDIVYLSSLWRSSVPHLLKYVICISKEIYNAAIAQIPIPQNRMRMIYDSFELSGAKEKNVLSKKSLIYPGRIAPSKGQDIFLSCIAILKSEGIKLEAVLAGNPSKETEPYARRLRELAADLKIEDQVLWAGYTEDINSMMRKSFGLVCASHREGLGRIIFEAWDAGIVPIAYRHSGGPAEIIQESGGGILFDSLDGISLAKAINQLLRLDQTAYDDHIQKGREWLLQNCDVSMYCRRLYDLWRSSVES
mgnify:CR=1 FL=1